MTLFKNYLDNEIAKLEAGSSLPDPVTFVNTFAQVEYNGDPFTLPQFVIFDTYTTQGDVIATPNDVGEGLSDGLVVVDGGWYIAEVEVDFEGTESPFVSDFTFAPAVYVLHPEDFIYSTQLPSQFLRAGQDLNNEYYKVTSSPFPAIQGSIIRFNLNANISSLNESYARMVLRKL